ncbi:MAG: helix-turn-helix domain-containing protein [Lachnospiraceae bacterium]|nr:helix-turn-helix domain-containing protein [Lachnospiraceae bacterium]
MSDLNQIQKSLAELKKLTGLTLTMERMSEGSEEEAAEKLNRLVTAWKSSYDREAFIRKLLTGAFREDDLENAASRFRLKEHTSRELYLVRAGDPFGHEAERVLKNLFVTKSGDLFVKMNDHLIVLIREHDPSAGPEQIEVTAHTIADMLSTEILVYAKVAYGLTGEALSDLSGTYGDALTALKIGDIFYSNEQVLTYGSLGLGKLIYDLPVESCRKFLAETLGDVDPAGFDDETVALINAFFENNLSIAEASRQLYLHRNTMSYRLDKLRQLTGLDLRVFDDALSLKVAMMIAGRLKAE